MTYIEKNIIESYFGFIDGLSHSGRIELIGKILKSLNKDKKTDEIRFFKSFGSFVSDKSPEDIINEIKMSRKFRKKEIEL